MSLNALTQISMNNAKPTSTSPNVLQEIIAHKHAELNRTVTTSFDRPAEFGPVRDFTAALAAPGSRFIFECKRKSPSSGEIRQGDIPEFIGAYEGIADAISVLTDEKYFGGSLADLRAARMLTNAPLLRKDFVAAPSQVHEAWAHGADAVLLMLSVLDDQTYHECAHAAHSRGLHVLTEVHDALEVQRAIALQAKVIGINNRDLRSLNIDLSVTEALAAAVPDHVLKISESGIRSHVDVKRLSPLVDGFLVGSSLMQADNMALAARELAFGAVKVCGLTSAQDAREVYQCGASYGGLIFASESKRCVSVVQAQNIVNVAPLRFVGVFTTQSVQAITDICAQLKLSAVQLHGDYSDAQLAQLHQQLPLPVAIWKVLHVRDGDNLACHLQAIAHCHALCAGRSLRVLLDTYGSARGGNGHVFDWSALNNLAGVGDLIIAGGIGPINCARARRTGAGIIDLNSCIETSPGIKDSRLIRRVFDQLRMAYAINPIEGKIV